MFYLILLSPIVIIRQDVVRLATIIVHFSVISGEAPIICNGEPRENPIIAIADICCQLSVIYLVRRTYPQAP